MSGWKKIYIGYLGDGKWALCECDLGKTPDISAETLKPYWVPLIDYKIALSGAKKIVEKLNAEKRDLVGFEFPERIY